MKKIKSITTFSELPSNDTITTSQGTTYNVKLDADKVKNGEKKGEIGGEGGSGRGMVNKGKKGSGSNKPRRSSGSGKRRSGIDKERGKEGAGGDKGRGRRRSNSNRGGGREVVVGDQKVVEQREWKKESREEIESAKEKISIQNGSGTFMTQDEGMLSFK